MAALQAGQLDRRIKLFQREIVRDAEFGATRETFSLMAEIWAQAVPWRGSEAALETDAGVSAVERVAFRVRWRPDLLRTQQIEDGDGRRYVITSMREIRRRAEVVIEAEERGAN